MTPPTSQNAFTRELVLSKADVCQPTSPLDHEESGASLCAEAPGRQERAITSGTSSRKTGAAVWTCAFFQAAAEGERPESGRVKKNVEPLPTSLVTPIRPPWPSTIFFTMARPRPVLFSPAVLLTLVFWNSWKTLPS